MSLNIRVSRPKAMVRRHAAGLLAIGFALVTFALLSESAFAQHRLYKQYGVEEGLPSLEIYEVLQDRSGYLWVATNKGLARYDGYQFQRFSTQDGLMDNSVLGLYEDHLGRVWFLSSSGGLCHWDQDSIRSYEHNDSLLKHLPRGYTDRIHIEEDGTLWLVPLGEAGLMKLDSAGNVTWFYNQAQCNTVFTKVFEGGAMLSGYCGIRNATAFHFLLETPQGQYDLSDQVSKLQLRKAETVLLKNGDLLVAHANRVYKLRGHAVVDSVETDKPVTSMYQDHEGVLWITTGSQVYVFRREDFSNSEQWLQGKRPCHILKDREGAYWVASLVAGLIYFPPLAWFSLTDELSELDRQSVYALDVGNGYLASGYSNGFAELRTSLSGRGARTQITVPTNDYMPEVHIDRSFVLTGKFSYKYRFNGELVRPNLFESLGRIIRIKKAENGDLLCATYHRFSRLRNDSIIYGFRCEERLTSVCEDHEQQVWLSTRNGLNKVIDGAMQKAFPEFNQQVTDIIAGPEKTLWVLTNGNGVYVIRNGEIFSLPDNDRLTSGICNRAFVDPFGNVWIGTNLGLNRLKIETLEPFRCSVETYTTADGLPSNQVNDIDLWKDTLIVATGLGMSWIPLESISTNAIPPKVHLQTFSVNQKVLPFEKREMLSNDQNELAFHFVGLSFRHRGNLLYRYKLLGQDEDWIYTHDQSVRYTNLEPGSYTFMVAASNNSEVWSETKLLDGITINAHYTDEIWFRVLCAIGGLALLVAICYSIIQTQRTHEFNKRNRMIAEQRALLAQMNPHFMFNSLNAIQLFVARNQKSEANLYLSKFSKLMRQVLDHSQRRWVTLREELETIELYLRLEQLRFEGRIEYEIKKDGEIEVDEMSIPPMLLQPLLENAIWHGLTPKEGMGVLILSVVLLENYLEFTVEDNGVGRAHAEKVQSKRLSSHKSTGLENIRERLQLMFESDEVDDLLQIEDLVNGQAPMGTRVRLRLPLNSLLGR